jgi:hypothetical protein
MLIHIVCWKYKPDVSEPEREEHRSRLRSLAPIIDTVRSLSVGADMLHLDRSFDSGLVVEFDGLAGLDAYTVHPDHQAVAALGRELAEKVVSVDFLRPD